MQGRNIWPGIIAVLFMIGLFIWLLAEARGGDRMAIAVLAVIASVLLILIGWGFSTLTNVISDRREQKQFTDNIRENLAIMAAMQKVQNQQNAMLLNQAKEAPRLPSPGGDVWDVDALVMDDDVFGDLDE